MIKEDLHKKDIVYYARIIPNLGIYEVCEIIIRTIEEDYFAGIDKHTKRAYLFSYNDVDSIIFEVNISLEKDYSGRDRFIFIWNH